MSYYLTWQACFLDQCPGNPSLPTCSAGTAHSDTYESVLADLPYLYKSTSPGASQNHSGSHSPLIGIKGIKLISFGNFIPFANHSCKGLCPAVSFCLMICKLITICLLTKCDMKPDCFKVQVWAQQNQKWLFWMYKKHLGIWITSFTRVIKIKGFLFICLQKVYWQIQKRNHRTPGK